MSPLPAVHAATSSLSTTRLADAVARAFAESWHDAIYRAPMPAMPEDWQGRSPSWLVELVEPCVERARADWAFPAWEGLALLARLSWERPRELARQAWIEALQDPRFVDLVSCVYYSRRDWLAEQTELRWHVLAHREELEALREMLVDGGVDLHDDIRALDHYLVQLPIDETELAPQDARGDMLDEVACSYPLAWWLRQETGRWNSGLLAGLRGIRAKGATDEEQRAYRAASVRGLLGDAETACEWLTAVRRGEPPPLGLQAVQGDAGRCARHDRRGDDLDLGRGA